MFIPQPTDILTKAAFLLDDKRRLLRTVTTVDMYT
jgi:hypothetical protein